MHSGRFGNKFFVSIALSFIAEKNNLLCSYDDANNFEKLGLANIELLTGNFDTTLTSAIAKAGQVDLAFIDGNHRYEPTRRYFKEMLPSIHPYSMLIFDDIHWSSEMEQVWKEIQEHASVTLTIDLFFIGIVLFRKENKAKQHFTIRF